MNKEQIIDEVYNNYLNEWTFEKYPNDGSVYSVEPIKVKEHTKEQFVYRCKTDTEFSERWGLKIEERELSLEERFQISDKINKELRQDLYSYMFNNPIYVGDLIYSDDEARHLLLNDLNIPTKKITLKYNNETMDFYE